MAEIEFCDRDWSRVRRDYTAWWRGDLDRPLICLCLPRPGATRPYSSFMTNWPAGMSDDELVDATTRQVNATVCFGDAFPFHFVNFGPGIAAAFMGATLQASPETVWFKPPARHRLSDLKTGFAPANSWWRRVERVTRLLAERLGERVAISFPDIGGNLDILAALRGTQDLLIDLVSCPDDVSAISRSITRTWLQIYDRLHAVMEPHGAGTVAWARIWAPGRTYIFQSDLSYMVSPDMFSEFVAPDLAACCDRIDYSFYHLDGPGQIPHLKHLCAIEKLKGIQWVAGTGNRPSSDWPEVLGTIREAGKLCQIKGTPQQIIDVVKRHGGKGFHFIASGGGLDAAAARRFLRDARVPRP